MQLTSAEADWRTKTDSALHETAQQLSDSHRLEAKRVQTQADRKVKAAQREAAAAQAKTGELLPAMNDKLIRCITLRCRACLQG